MGDWSGTVSESYSSNSYFSCTPNSAAHTKGAWAGFLGPVSGVGIILRITYWPYYSTPRTILFDVGIGESGSQQVLIPNVIFSPSHFGSGEYLTRIQTEDIRIPICIPYAKIWVRAQSSMAGHTLQGWVEPSVITYGQDPVGSVCDSYGVSSATSLGTAVTADNEDSVFGAWVQITNSCEQIRSFFVASNAGTLSLSTYTNQWAAFQVAVGPPGGEVIVLFPPEGGASSSYTGVSSPHFMGPYSINIPAGSRISIRHRVQYTGSSQRVRYYSIYGIR